MKIPFKYIFVNFLTFIRLLLTFYIVIKDNFVSQDLFTLAVIFSTDFFDGYFARKLNAHSSFGREFDQLTDKVVFYLLYYKAILFGYGNYYFLFLFILRDTIISSLRLIKYKSQFLASSMINKLKTTLQFVIILLSFVMYSFNYSIEGLVFFITIIALILCFYPIIRILKDEF